MPQVEPTGAEPTFSVEPDNNGLYQIDDMILDEYEFQEMYHSKSGKPNKQYRWPKGEVPYEYNIIFIICMSRGTKHFFITGYVQIPGAMLSFEFKLIYVTRGKLELNFTYIERVMVIQAKLEG